MTYVLDAKTMKIVMKIWNFVAKENVFFSIAKNKVIVDWATNASLRRMNVSLDVNIIETVRRAKNALKTIVPFQQVINHLCYLIYFSIWYSLT